MEKLSLHQQYIAKNSPAYVQELLNSGNLKSGGQFTTKVKSWFGDHYSVQKIYLNPSCTSSLEMACLISDLRPGDEIIVPSYTYVSTANAFAGRGYKIKFADCTPQRPNVSLETIVPLVSDRTRVIVVMHYCGIAVDMDPILEYCKKHSILLIEDAAHAMGARYKNQALGTLGDMGTISFHSTKICSCGEGGSLFLNNAALRERAECVFEKGTNKNEFEKKSLDRYEWVTTGSSFAMSEIQAAFLSGQLEAFEYVLNHRKSIWQTYLKSLKQFEKEGYLECPDVPEFAEVNGSHFYIVLEDEKTRIKLIDYLNTHGIGSAFHYLSLHRSPFIGNPEQQSLPNSDKFEKRLLRLPVHMDVDDLFVERIVKLLKGFFR